MGDQFVGSDGDAALARAGVAARDVKLVRPLPFDTFVGLDMNGIAAAAAEPQRLRIGGGRQNQAGQRRRKCASCRFHRAH